jgi:hypothetical protein
MPLFNKTFLFRTRVEIDVDIVVRANSEEEATERHASGAWQSVSPPNWDNPYSWRAVAPPVEIKP